MWVLGTDIDTLNTTESSLQCKKFTVIIHFFFFGDKVSNYVAHLGLQFRNKSSYAQSAEIKGMNVRHLKKISILSYMSVLTICLYVYCASLRSQMKVPDTLELEI